MVDAIDAHDGARQPATTEATAGEQPPTLSRLRRAGVMCVLSHGRV